MGKLLKQKKTNRLFLVLFSVFLGACCFSSSSYASSLHKTPIADSYNNVIIEDPTFAASNTMTVVDIQNFLNSQMPDCDTNGDKLIYDSRDGYTKTRRQYAADRGVYTPFTCLRNYSENGLSSSQIIYNTAQEIGINPQVILVVLQKEQSLITDDWPWPINYRSAMGMGCPESSACDSKYYGLANQVSYGSKLLKAVYNKSCDPEGPLYNFTYFNTFKDQFRTIDNKATLVGSCATAALYQYTPHRPDSAWIDVWDGYSYVNYYGNYNFIYYFNKWFKTSDAIRTSVRSNPGVDFDKSNVLLGENITGNMTLKNYSDAEIDLEKIVIVAINKNTGKQTDLLYTSHNFTPEGDQGDTLSVDVPFSPVEAGEYKFFVMTYYNNEWISLSGYSYIAVTKPNIKTSWFLVPSKAAVNIPVTPQLKIKNFESVPVTLESVGTAVWYQWPQPKDRSFAFQNAVTIPANSEITVDIPAKTFTEIGSYGYWPIYKIAGNWYQLDHITGWPTFGWMEITKPNIKTSWFLVPSKAAVNIPVTPQLKIKNFESVPVTLESVGTAVWYQWPQPKDRSFAFQNAVTIPANSEITVDIPAKTFTEIGSYGYWPIYKIAGNWYQLDHITGWPTFGWMEITKPNIKTSWFLVPSKAAVNIPVTPQLKIKNFESVPVTLESVGTAVWYQWPQPKDRSFAFQNAVTIPANSEITVDIPAKTFTEIGSYGYWPIYKIAGNWYQLDHITGWPTFGWMEIQG